MNSWDQRMHEFRAEVKPVLNGLGVDNALDISDIALADFLAECLGSLMVIKIREHGWLPDHGPVR